MSEAAANSSGGGTVEYIQHHLTNLCAGSGCETGGFMSWHLDTIVVSVFLGALMVFAAGQSLTLSMELLMLEIGGSVLFGIIMGRLLAWAGLLVQQRRLHLPLTLGFILILVGLADVLNLSSLLAAMALGFSTRYFSRASGDKLFVPIESIENVVFIIFFTLAGAHFQLDVFTQHISLIVIYLLARIAGKVTGAVMGARFAGAPKNVSRWLGIGLMPQAGVAIGLSLILGQYAAFNEISIIVVNVILATTLFNELLGPIAARVALEQAGELGEKRKRSQA